MSNFGSLPGRAGGLPLAIMKDSGIVRLIATVSGRVQGVGYRYFAEQEAHRLGLTGFVRNMPDGSVEVVAEGDKNVLDGFLLLLRRGPSSAEVANIKSTFVPATGEFYDFTIRRWH
jgi:acylphosphatase